jgi:hypothetical protein
MDVRLRHLVDVDLDVLWPTILVDLPALLDGLPRPAADA